MNDNAAIFAETEAPEKPSAMRTSEILRGILTRNPDVQRFSVRRILSSIGNDRFEASLMMFSLPAILPVPSPSGIATMPTGAIAYQLAAGRKQIRLPNFILKKSVSRKSLAVAIHTMLPVLEAAEKVVRPRWGWMSHPAARRAIGVLLFLLAVAIAYPLSSFSVLHALSIFIVALGLAEQDGAAVLFGLVAGILSLALLAASGPTARALRSKVVGALRKLARKAGVQASVRLLQRLGYPRLASMLTFKLPSLLMMWDPEQRLPAGVAPAGVRRARRRRAREARRRRLLLQRGAAEQQALRFGSGRETIEAARAPSIDYARAEVREQAYV